MLFRSRVLDIVLCIAFIAVAIGLINKAYIYKKDEMSVKEMVYRIIDQKSKTNVLLCKNCFSNSWWYNAT